MSIATCKSKSILRAVADEVCSKFDYVDYFPSYDILTSPAALGRYFKKDLREVNEHGVSLAMNAYMNNYVVSKNSEESILDVTDPECDEVFYGKVNS